jgi:hypothetical protein
MPNQLFALEQYQATGADPVAPPELSSNAAVHLIGLVRLPEDEVVLAFVEGPDAEAVTACLSDVGWRVDRITPARWLSPSVVRPTRPHSVLPPTQEILDV